MILMFTFPLWLGKQIINVIQMYRAAVLLAESDVEERRALAEK